MKLFLVRSIGIWTKKVPTKIREVYFHNLFLSQCLFTLREDICKQNNQKLTKDDRFLLSFYLIFSLRIKILLSFYKSKLKLKC